MKRKVEKGEMGVSPMKTVPTGLTKHVRGELDATTW